MHIIDGCAHDANTCPNHAHGRAHDADPVAHVAHSLSDYADGRTHHADFGAHVLPGQRTGQGRHLPRAGGQRWEPADVDDCTVGCRGAL